MRISHLRVENCSRLPDVDLDVRNHLVVAGANESGKTSLLRLIDAAISWSTARLITELSTGWRESEDRPLVVVVELSELTEDELGAFADEVDLSNPDEPTLTVELELEVSGEGADPEVNRRFSKADGSVSPVQSRHLNQIPWVLLSAERRLDHDLGGSTRGVLRRTISGLNLEANEQDIANAFAELESKISANPEVVGLKSAVAVALSSLLPAEVGPDDLRVGVAGEEGIPTVLDIGFNTGRTFVEQSDGWKSLATLAMQLFENQRSTIVAIDEPEVHLHPRSQAMTGTTLRNSEGQVVVATHSPAIVRSFVPGEVAVITPTGSRQLPDESVALDPKFYSRWWTEHALEPVTASTVICVEGVSDAMVLTAAARLAGFDLDRNGISVVSVNGNHEFKPAIRLFGDEGFCVPMLLLVDRKEAPELADWLGKDLANVEDDQVFVSDPDLEGEYCQALGAERVVQLLVDSGLVRLQDIQQAADDLADDNEVADFCRGRKIIAGSAVANGLRSTDRIPAIERLLAVVGGGGSTP